MTINLNEIARTLIDEYTRAENADQLETTRDKYGKHLASHFYDLPYPERQQLEAAFGAALRRIEPPAGQSTPAAIAGPAQTNASAELSRLRGQVAELSRENATLKETVSRQAARLQTLTAQQAAIDEKAAKVRQFRNSCGSESLAKVAAGITIPPAGRM